MAYFIAHWTKQLPSGVRERVEADLESVDPSAVLVYTNAPGTTTRMWLERPDDGTNNYNNVVQRNAELRTIVESALNPVKVEAYGVRGPQSKPWRRTFPSRDAFKKWVEKNDGDISLRGTREGE